MNLPNKLTVLRVILVPFFVVFMLASPLMGTAGRFIALILFVIASLTDLLDGKIARKYNLVTNFGKFMDPLADKLLVVSALVCFISLERMPAWIVIVIIAREFIISGFRLVAAEAGIVIAASWWGKWKTAVTMITIIFMIPDFASIAVLPPTIRTGICVVEQILIYASLILTVVSLIDYLIKNRHVILGGEM